ncbi:hypothetical protein [uncultured Cloacibacillus sp.]|nr:hypothetical protein [uncultured Cloacibacillus sp.]
MEVKKLIARKQGFVIVTVLIFGGVLMICASLAFQVATAMFEENNISTERLRIENATAQASALAEEWLRVNIKDIAKGDYFAISAEPVDSPVLDVPNDFFQIMTEEYPSYNFSCQTIDLHYADKFTASADKLRIPRIPPVETPGGAIERAYIQKVTVTPAKNKNAAYTYTKSLRAIKDTSGDLRCIVVGITD